MVDSTKILITLEKDLYERIKCQAVRFGNSASAYIRMAVSEKLEKDETSKMSSKYRTHLQDI